MEIEHSCCSICNLLASSLPCTSWWFNVLIALKYLEVVWVRFCLIQNACCHICKSKLICHVLVLCCFSVGSLWVSLFLCACMGDSFSSHSALMFRGLCLPAFKEHAISAYLCFCFACMHAWDMLACTCVLLEMEGSMRLLLRLLCMHGIRTCMLLYL